MPGMCDVVVGFPRGVEPAAAGETAEGSAQGSVCGRWAMKGTQMNNLIAMKKPVARAEAVPTVREASTGAVTTMLPRVWAVAAGGGCRSRMPAAVPSSAAPTVPVMAPGRLRLVAGCETQRSGFRARVRAAAPEMVFYRTYTEGMLRRYLRLSMSGGRVSSLLGRELFRGKVTSYKVRSFDDVVIFCLDVEKCLAKLEPIERELLKRIAVQQYTQAEAAALMGMSLRGCVMRYHEALDRLTAILLAARLMEPLESCQGGELVPVGVSATGKGA